MAMASPIHGHGVRRCVRSGDTTMPTASPARSATIVYLVSSPIPSVAPRMSQRRRSPVLRSRAVTQKHTSHISWSSVTVSKSQLAPSSTGLAAAPMAARMRAFRPPPSSRAISAARTIITDPARLGHSRNPQTLVPNSDWLSRAIAGVTGG